MSVLSCINYDMRVSVNCTICTMCVAAVGGFVGRSVGLALLHDVAMRTHNPNEHWRRIEFTK
jgi:hypothetical protein